MHAGPQPAEKRNTAAKKEGKNGEWRSNHRSNLPLLTFQNNRPNMSTEQPMVGVLALQGAFEEHQACLEAVGCRTVQVSIVLRVLATGRSIILI
jgi:hypothetical protein